MAVIIYFDIHREMCLFIVLALLRNKVSMSKDIRARYIPCLLMDDHYMYQKPGQNNLVGIDQLWVRIHAAEWGVFISTICKMYEQLRLLKTPIHYVGYSKDLIHANVHFCFYFLLYSIKVRSLITEDYIYLYTIFQWHAKIGKLIKNHLLIRRSDNYLSIQIG
jgi:hypothetical protein